jgi:hypothetical protein
MQKSAKEIIRININELNILRIHKAYGIDIEHKASPGRRVSYSHGVTNCPTQTFFAGMISNILSCAYHRHIPLRCTKWPQELKIEKCINVISIGPVYNFNCFNITRFC